MLTNGPFLAQGADVLHDNNIYLTLFTADT